MSFPRGIPSASKQVCECVCVRVRACVLDAMKPKHTHHILTQFFFNYKLQKNVYGMRNAFFFIFCIQQLSAAEVRLILYDLIISM